MEIVNKVNERLENFERYSAAEQKEFINYLFDIACDASNVGIILSGRRTLLKLPRELVLSNIEEAATKFLQRDDEWNFRRFVELIWVLDKTQVGKFARVGLNSLNLEIQEAAQDYLDALLNHREGNFL